MYIEYSSNNSGGGWWLEDKDWINLEKAGWKVDWFANDEEMTFKDKDGKRFLGALASRAYFKGTEYEAIQSFQEITGENVEDEGCSCCGNPHNFYTEKDETIINNFFGE